jgi:hypothetical protein
MKVSMDGLRRNLASAYSKAVDGFHDVTEGRDLDEFSELKNGLDELRQMIAALMCVYSPNPDDLMTDMEAMIDKLPFADPADVEGEDDEDDEPEEAVNS